MTKQVSILKTHVIPHDAPFIRHCLQKAAKLSQSEGFFAKRCGTTTYGSIAVACNAINTVRYLARAPFTTGREVMSLHPWGGIKEGGQDLFNAARCLVVSVVGVFAVAAGFFFPEKIYTAIVPAELPKTTASPEEFKKKRKKIKNLKWQNAQATQAQQNLQVNVQRLQSENNQLKNSFTQAQQNLQADVQRLQSENNQLKNNLAEVMEEKQNLALEIENLRKDKKELEDIRGMLNNQIKEMIGQVNKLQDEKGDGQAQPLQLGNAPTGTSYLESVLSRPQRMDKWKAFDEIEQAQPGYLGNNRSIGASELYNPSLIGVSTWKSPDAMSGAPTGAPTYPTSISSVIAPAAIPDMEPWTSKLD